MQTHPNTSFHSSTLVGCYIFALFFFRPPNIDWRKSIILKPPREDFQQRSSSIFGNIVSAEMLGFEILALLIIYGKKSSLQPHLRWRNYMLNWLFCSANLSRSIYLS